MRTIGVDLGDRSYSIHVGPQLISDASLIAPLLAQQRVAIVTNTTIAPLYLDRLTAQLQAAGIQVISIILPDGEQYKTWQTLNSIFDALIANRCERRTTLIALGGGVIGDLTGFAAATWQRGRPSSRFPPRCWRRWIRRSAARPPSTIPAARTWSGRSISPARCWPISIR